MNDVLDRLRAADPLRDADLPGADGPDAVALREQILAGATRTPVLAARRKRRIAVAVAVAAALAGAAAVAVVTRDVSDPTSVGCYGAPSTTASTVVVAATDASPVDQCRRLWETGQVRPNVTQPSQVPPLVACVLDSGVVGVFPTTSCELVDTSGAGPTDEPVAPTSPSPDLSPGTSSPDPPSDRLDKGLPTPDFGTDDEKVRQALNDIRLTIRDRCLGLEAAIAVAERILVDHGVEGWTVGPIFESRYTGRSCAGFFPRASERAVYFLPYEPGPGQTPQPR